MGGSVEVLLQMVGNGGFETGEREVVAVIQHRTGKLHCLGVALRGQSVYFGAAGIAQTQQSGYLVESFAGGVIAGLAEQLIVAVGVHFNQHRMAARHQQGNQRHRHICFF